MAPPDPTLTRLRDSGEPTQAFRDRGAAPWLLAGGIGLIALLILTVTGSVRPELMERTASLLSLTMLVAAMASWFRMGGRSIVIALVVVGLLYALSALTSLVEVHDLFVVSLLVGLALFVLAGFSLLFVLEEMVYDAHRLMRPLSNLWSAVPVFVVAALIAAVPLIEASTGFHMPVVRGMAIACAILLAFGWTLRALTHMGPPLTREIDLLVAGALAGALLADAISLLRASTGLMPTFVAYGAMVGTWIYVTFTTLQRAQYFLRAQDVVPWAALLLSSSYAVLAHVHAQYRASGALAFPDLIQVRVGYLLLGVWIGMAFFILRGLWRISLYLRDSQRIGRGMRVAAGRIARITEGALDSEHRLGDAAYRALQRVDKALPGPRTPPERPSYPRLDEREGAPVPERERRRPRRDRRFR